MHLKSWEAFEAHCQDLLGLRRTLASGSQWHDVGDGVDPDHTSAFRLMIDAKSTVRGSFTLNARFLGTWVQKAALLGCRFGLPLRFEKADGSHEDYMVVPLDDFAELLELARRGLARGD